jgi:hypothetical protein
MRQLKSPAEPSIGSSRPILEHAFRYCLDLVNERNLTKEKHVSNTRAADAFVGYSEQMGIDDQQRAARPAPLEKDALERIRSQLRPILAEHNSTVDALMADLRTEATHWNKPRSSNSEPFGEAFSDERPIRKATLKPDVVAQDKREWTKGDVNILRADLLFFGVEASDDSIFGAWERHSDSHSAGWLGLYGNADDNVRALLHYLDVAD